MRTTIELPDELLSEAKIKAALSGVSLRQFFVEAIKYKLSPVTGKIRREPPGIGNPQAAPMKALTREEIDEAMFG